MTFFFCFFSFDLQASSVCCWLLFWLWPPLWLCCDRGKPNWSLSGGWSQSGATWESPSVRWTVPALETGIKASHLYRWCLWLPGFPSFLQSLKWPLGCDSSGCKMLSVLFFTCKTMSPWVQRKNKLDFVFCCFSRIVSSLGGFPGTRVAGEGAESEEPAVSKGGNLPHWAPWGPLWFAFCPSASWNWNFFFFFFVNTTLLCRSGMDLSAVLLVAADLK